MQDDKMQGKKGLNRKSSGHMIKCFIGESGQV